MTAPDAFALLGAAVLGAGIGTLYFVGLWRTVRALPRQDRPGLTVLASFAARFALAAAVFVFLARAGGWPAAAAGLAGFLAARTLVIGRLHRAGRGSEGRPR